MDNEQTNKWLSCEVKTRKAYESIKIALKQNKQNKGDKIRRLNDLIVKYALTQIRRYDNTLSISTAHQDCIERHANQTFSGYDCPTTETSCSREKF